MESEPEDPLVECAVSGEKRPQSQMLPFGDKWVSPELKETFVQQLAEVQDTGEEALDGYPFPDNFSFVSMVQQSWTIWTAQLVPMLIFSAVILAPFYLLGEYLAYEVLDPQPSAGGLGREFQIERIIDFWVGSFVAAGLYSCALARWRGEGAWDLSRLFSGGKAFYTKILGTRFLVGLAVFGVVFLLVLPIVVVGEISIMIPLGVAAFCLFLYLFVRLGCAEAAAVLIERGGGEAIGCSWRITKGHFWKLLFYRVIFYAPLTLLAFLLGMLLAIPALNHFAVSALISTIIFLAMSIGVVFELVLAVHLVAVHDRKPAAEKNDEAADSQEPELPEPESPGP